MAIGCLKYQAMDITHDHVGYLVGIAKISWERIEITRQKKDNLCECAESLELRISIYSSGASTGISTFQFAVSCESLISLTTVPIFE